MGPKTWPQSHADRRVKPRVELRPVRLLVTSQQPRYWSHDVIEKQHKHKMCLLRTTRESDTLMNVFVSCDDDDDDDDAAAVM